MNSSDSPHPIDCLRCGTCCTKHQAIVSPEEAQRIASYLGVTMREWELAYSETRWHSANNYLIRHVNGACIFLKHDESVSYCDIHPCKPSCCIDWIPALERKECQQGLNRYRETTNKKEALP